MNKQQNIRGLHMGCGESLKAHKNPNTGLGKILSELKTKPTSTDKDKQEKRHDRHS